MLDALFHRREKLVESICKKFHAVDGKLIADRFHGNPGTLQGIHGGSRRFDVLFEAGTRMSMIAKCIVGGWRNGVHSFWSNQFLHVEHVAIRQILRPGAGPENALGVRAAGREHAPASGGKKLFVLLIGELGIGNCYLALQRA